MNHICDKGINKTDGLEKHRKAVETFLCKLIFSKLSRQTPDDNFSSVHYVILNISQGSR
jgi:hypothetical protein